MGFLNSATRLARLNAYNSIEDYIEHPKGYFIGTQLLTLMLCLFLLIWLSVIVTFKFYYKDKKIIILNKFFVPLIIFLSAFYVVISLSYLGPAFIIDKAFDNLDKLFIETLNVINTVTTVSKNMTLLSSKMNSNSLNLLCDVDYDWVSKLNVISSSTSPLYVDFKDFSNELDIFLIELTKLKRITYISFAINSTVTIIILLALSNILFGIHYWKKTKFLNIGKYLISGINVYLILNIIFNSMNIGNMLFYTILLGDFCEHPDIHKSILTVLRMKYNVNDTGIIEYYQTCNGNNILHSTYNATFELVYELKTDLLLINSTGESCNLFIDDYNDTINDMYSEYYKLIQYTGCSKLNSLYRNIFQESVCNQFGESVASFTLLFFLCLLIILIVILSLRFVNLNKSLKYNTIKPLGDVEMTQTKDKKGKLHNSTNI